MRAALSINRLPGPGDFSPPVDLAEVRAERADALAAQYRRDPAKCREAEQWVAGTFDGEHYAALTLALHELHYTDPSLLPGSDLLTTLYRLAVVEAGALDAQLLSMAEDDLHTQIDVAAEARECEARARSLDWLGDRLQGIRS